MSLTKVIIGVKYNHLTPIEVVGRDKFKLLMYKCKCDCGNTTIVRSRSLTTGKTTSCGCARRKSNGMHSSITYRSWISAKQRCENPHNHNYKNYGARGIRMCKDWSESFLRFFNDMGERPSKEFTLDRIDVNGNYEPSNCKWATHKEQSNNRRDNHFITYNGNKYTATQFAEQFGVGLNYLFYCFRSGILEPSEIIDRYNHRRKMNKHSTTDRGNGGYGSTGK